MADEKKKRKARPLLIVGAGIALAAIAGGSLACGNLIPPQCGDGGVQDPCSPRFGQQMENDAGADAGTDCGTGDAGP